jgi:hypothetical protein
MAWHALSKQNKTKLLSFLPFRPYSSDMDPVRDAVKKVRQLLMRLAKEAAAWASDPPKKQASGLESLSEKLEQWAVPV